MKSHGIKVFLAAFAACAACGLTTPAVPATRTPGGGNLKPAPDFSYFQIILDRMPFGQPPSPPAAAPPPEDVKQAQAEQALAKQIRLCAVTRTRQGVAAGLIDSSVNPAKNHYLYVGDTMDGLTLVSANLEAETAEIEKDGVRLTFTMTGVKSGTSPATDLALASRALPVKTEAPTGSTAFPPRVAAAANSSDTITSSAKIIRRSSHMGGTPPLPVSSNLQFAEMQRRSEELKAFREAGGDAKSYIAHVRERKQAENAQKEAAEEAARKQIWELAQKMTEDELKKREREINLNLIGQGARPLSSIELTPEEEQDFVQRGVLP